MCFECARGDGGVGIEKWGKQVMPDRNPEVGRSSRSVILRLCLPTFCFTNTRSWSLRFFFRCGSVIFSRKASDPSADGVLIEPVL